MTTAADGKTYHVDHYNLDGIISKVWSFCNTLRDDGMGYSEKNAALLPRHASKYAPPTLDKIPAGGL